MIDGTYYSDEEQPARLREATKHASEPKQELEAAFESLGFNPATF